VQIPGLFVSRPVPLLSTFIRFLYYSNHAPPIILSVDCSYSELSMASFKKLTKKMNERINKDANTTNWK
jgi:hypothetical protein